MTHKQQSANSPGLTSRAAVVFAWIYTILLALASCAAPLFMCAAKQGRAASSFFRYRYANALSLSFHLLKAAVEPFAYFAAGQARSLQLCSGYSPSSMNMGNLPQSQAIHYDNNFVKNLKANTPYVRVTNRRELPEKSGNQHKLFMYQTLSANTAQVADGVVGSGITVSVVSNTSTIGQYADYVNMSDLSLQTAIDPALENIGRELAYRLALGLSTIVRNTADGAANIDSSVNANNKLANAPFTKTDITTNIQSLAGRNVAAFSNGRMAGVIHPFIIGDALNDVSNNSLTDVLKRSAEGQMKLAELPNADGDEVQVLEWAGCMFYATTMVTQTANYLGSGKTALRTYIIGENGLISISLGKTANSQIGNGDWRNLKVFTRTYNEGDRSDPSNVIGGSTAYNVKFTVTTPPDTTQRLRTIDAVSNIS